MVGVLGIEQRLKGSVPMERILPQGAVHPLEYWNSGRTRMDTVKI